MKSLLLCFYLSMLIKSLNFTYTPSFDSYFLSSGFASPDGTSWNNFNTYPYGMGDVNGDGKADIVAFGATYVYVSLSNGTHFLSPTSWGSGCFSSAQGFTSQDYTPRWVADVNGDGRADAVGFGIYDVFVSLSTGSSFTGCDLWCIGCYTTDTGWTSITQNLKTLYDLNGDGRADLYGTLVSQISVVTSSGASFNLPISYYTDNSNWISQDVDPRFLGDLNGDKKGDLIGLESGIKGVYIAMGNGASTYTKQLWTSDLGSLGEFSSQSLTPRYIADFDGDGKDDILGIVPSGLYIEFSQGYILTPKILVYNYTDDNGIYLDISKSFLLIGDVDGDGKKDFVAITNTGNGIKAYTSKCTHQILSKKNRIPFKI